jgi:hypothetical protein
MMHIGSSRDTNTNNRIPIGDVVERGCTPPARMSQPQLHRTVSDNITQW